MGTTDAQGLDIRTNNMNRIRIDQNGYVGVNTNPSANFQMAVVSTATNALTGQTSAGNGVGVYGLSNSATGFGIYGYNSNASGTGVFGSGNNITGQYLAGGSGGAFSSTNVGVYGWGNNTNQSWGVYGVSNNSNGEGVVGSINAASGAGTGNGVYGYSNQSQGAGVYAQNTNTSGTGLIAGGNNILPWYLPAGSGGAFTGSPYGIAVFKDGAITNGQFAGYFIASTTASTGVVIAGRSGGTNYKILNIGGFGGNVSTDVWGAEGKKDARIMFCPEAPEILFQESGTGQLQNGRAHIDLDPIFSRNIVVNEQHPLRVFIQLNDECNGVYVTNRTQKGFDVIELNNGRSNAKFTWFIIANRADYVDPETGELISKHEGVRFPLAPKAEELLQKANIEISNNKKPILYNRK